MRQRSAIAVLSILPALSAGGLFAAAQPTLGDQLIIAAIKAQSSANDTFYAEAIFLLQSIAISSGMILGLLIFSTWLRGRQSRMP